MYANRRVSGEDWHNARVAANTCVLERTQQARILEPTRAPELGVRLFGVHIQGRIHKGPEFINVCQARCTSSSNLETERAASAANAICETAAANSTIMKRAGGFRRTQWRRTTKIQRTFEPIKLRHPCRGRLRQACGLDESSAFRFTCTRAGSSFLR